MLQAMQVEIGGLSDDIDDVTPVLEAHGFSMKPLDWVDPEGTSMKWIIASVKTEYPDTFHEFVYSLVGGPYSAVTIDTFGPAKEAPEGNEND